jgi:hypothetical protein
MLDHEIAQQAMLLKKDEVGILRSEVVAAPVLTSTLPALELEGEKCTQTRAKQQREEVLDNLAHMSSIILGCYQRCGELFFDIRLTASP